MAERPSLASSLERITSIANQLASGCPNARELVRELFVAFSEVQESYRGPKPIATAPQVPERTFLLFCPEQGGWHTGEWCNGHWLDSKTLSDELEPTHWMEAPPEPEA